MGEFTANLALYRLRQIQRRDEISYGEASHYLVPTCNPANQSALI